MNLNLFKSHGAPQFLLQMPPVGDYTISPQSGLQEKMKKRFVCLEDFEEEAQAKLPESYWKFHNQGAYYSNTAKDNVEAYKK